MSRELFYTIHEVDGKDVEDNNSNGPFKLIAENPYYFVTEDKTGHWVIWLRKEFYIKVAYMDVEGEEGE